MLITMCISIFLVLTCIDMGIKQYIEDTFEKGEERETIIPKLVLRKVYNKGFAFNLLDRHPDMVRKGSVCAIAGILLCDLRLFFEKRKRLKKLGMALVSAGAFSNIYDRLIREKVVDYIGVKCKSSFISKITANLADIYIVAGMILVTLSRIAYKNKK